MPGSWWRPRPIRSRSIIIGFGQLAYTVSDPRSVVIKRFANRLAEQAGALRQSLVVERTETVMQTPRATWRPRSRRRSGRPCQVVRRGWGGRDLPEALTLREMFERFAAILPGLPLLANMTEFGRTPFFTADKFQARGYRMVIWPVSSLRVAKRAQAT